MRAVTRPAAAATKTRSKTTCAVTSTRAAWPEACTSPNPMVETLDTALVLDGEQEVDEEDQGDQRAETQHPSRHACLPDSGSVWSTVGLAQQCGFTRSG